MRRATVLACLVLGGCVGPGFVGAGTELADFVASGARRVLPEERAQLLSGNTLVAEGVRVHYAPDGTKAIAVEDGPSINRRWRVRDDGVMCEELTVSAGELCADHGILYEKDGLFRAFRPDGTATAMSFTIEPGGATSDEVGAGVDAPNTDAEPDRPEDEVVVRTE